MNNAWIFKHMYISRIFNEIKQKTKYVYVFFIGKRYVACRSQGQISIPEYIDPETQVLDLSGNNLQILPKEVFSRHGLINIQRLHLANCNLGQIDPSAFRGLTNLVELNLAGNLLTAVPTATFAGRKNVQLQGDF